MRCAVLNVGVSNRVGSKTEANFRTFDPPPSNSERVWQNAERDYRVVSLRPRLWYTFDERPVHGGGD